MLALTYRKCLKLHPNGQIPPDTSPVNNAAIQPNLAQSRQEVPPKPQHNLIRLIFKTKHSAFLPAQTSKKRDNFKLFSNPGAVVCITHAINCGHT